MDAVVTLEWSFAQEVVSAFALCELGARAIWKALEAIWRLWNGSGCWLDAHGDDLRTVQSEKFALALQGRSHSRFSQVFNNCGNLGRWPKLNPYRHFQYPLIHSGASWISLTSL